MGGGDGRGEARPGDADTRRPGQERRERMDEAARELGFGAPQAVEPVDVDGEPAEAGLGDVARPGDPGAERRKALARGLDGVPIGVRVEVEEGRLGREPVCAPERDRPPDAERPSLGIRVDDRPVGPRLSAEDDRAVRPRAGGGRPLEARAGEPERQVGPEEVEQSHGDRAIAVLPGR